MPSNNNAKLPMVSDGTVVRFRYYGTEYKNIEYHAKIKSGLIEVKSERLTPSGAARRVDKLIRGEDATTWNGWRKWEWNSGDGTWVEIDELRETDD
jgi:hypothetical protein